MKEAAQGMVVIIGNAVDMDAKGFEELTAPSMPTVFTKGKSVVDVDDDDFVDKTPLAKRLRKKAPPLLNLYTQISSANISYTDNDIDEMSIVYYTSLDTINKDD